uniref:NPH3 domain-containing protein n=1 Tax=Oryza sativa subsp. japonica TaxID=39947 RepID=Q8S6I9_ORYSJ|nr:Hypothetical protein with similarity to putative photoreceptor interacting protein [Oryza sativa Japonica Group]
MALAPQAAARWSHASARAPQAAALASVLNCRKLSDKACAHEAQNELIPLRVVVQVLFFEHARAVFKIAMHPMKLEED